MNQSKDLPNVEGEAYLKFDKIALFGSQSFIDSFSKERILSGFCVGAHTEFYNLVCWLLNEKPQMVILESEALKKLLISEIKNIKATLTDLGIISLIVAQSLDDINQWRESSWPQVQFYLGIPNVNRFPQKISDLLNERLLLEQPLVVLVTRKANLSHSIEASFSRFNVRVKVCDLTDEYSLVEMAAVLKPEVIVWDMDSLCKEKFLNRLKEKYFWLDSISFYYLSEHSGPKAMVKLNHDNHPNHIFHTSEIESLVQSIVEQITSQRHQQVRVCKDLNTGLFDQDTYREVVERLIRLSGRRGEEMSFIRLSLNDFDKIQADFGSIFTRALEMNWGVFIRNRVRGSDLVAKGGKGVLLIVLPHTDISGAKIAVSRLLEQFSKDVAFEGPGSFRPTFTAKLLSFPGDINSISDLDSFLDGELPALEDAKDSWRDVVSIC